MSQTKKAIWVNEPTHRLVKMQAARDGKTTSDYIENLVLEDQTEFPPAKCTDRYGTCDEEECNCDR